MDYKKAKVLILLTVFILTFFSSISCIPVYACECGYDHTEPYHVGDDLITVSKSSSGNGWEWNHKTKTLVLTNANIANTIPEEFIPSYPGEKRPETPGKYAYDAGPSNSVINLPPNAIVKLNGKNTITATEFRTTTFPFAITICDTALSSLTVKGPGSLQANATINAHKLVFDGATVNINPATKESFGGLGCYELHINNSVVNPNSNISFVAKLEIKGGTLYVKNNEGGEMPGAIYFFKNHDLTKFDAKYKTATGYDGETIGKNSGMYSTFFEKKDGATVEATDIMIKGKTTSGSNQTTSTNSTTSKVPNEKPSNNQSTEATTSKDETEQPKADKEVVVEQEDIKVKYDYKVFPATTVLHAVKLTSGTIYETAAQTLSEVTTNFVAYDINATDNGAKVQPNGVVTVTFDIPNGYDTKKTSVYYVSDSGYEKIPSTIDKNSNTITAELSHFSIYVVAEENVAPINNDNSGTPVYKYIAVASSVVAACLAGVLVYSIVKAKKKKSS